MKDVGIVRARITPAMMGADCFLAVNSDGYKGMEYGELFNAALQRVGKERERSYSQLGLYWVACKFVANNTEDRDWNTQDKVDEQCKIKARFVKFWIYYENQKTGEKWCHIKTRSISFKELPHLEACGYFDEAFQILSDEVGMDIDDFICAVKECMGGGAAA